MMQSENLVEFFKYVSICAGVSDDKIKNIATLAVPRRFKTWRIHLLARGYTTVFLRRP